LINHYAALPYRLDEAGKLEILLITSKERRRWVIPKGNPIPSMANYETAAREAFEEAGVEGGISAEPLGSFRYQKRRRSGLDTPAHVTVHPMLVTRLARRWPERGERELRWFTPEAAAEAVEEPELKEIIVSLNGRI
jgi:8-oxo-dGTP pyrophosphatase MutT (NUDIX family)